ncbi:alpha-glucosidase [Companilactobacillus allii]|uniref:Glucohydrolase n=1 Tax=Companilactobacillus allii TaxID=1847728 RepID=A0A1P8Q652_9LACO|nr:alpha-glucosidase [Companilactobacillus allii]APX73305.1 glucohydrolase [Companilactobacillus allii]USQ68413.1 alpha-glucosidase [Companilactobacillus allii]
MNDIKWWKNSVVYQVYPKSFNDSNNDGIGDIAGITEKLGYLKKLGVDVIWLNPIYVSPQVDNGYDISNYRKIDPRLGSDEEFETLLNSAHEMGIKIILDLVVNHTSSEHPWFKDALKSKDSKYHNYYIWKDGKPDETPNNWGSSFGGSTWDYVDKLGQYYLHLFAKEQPDLNWENPNVRQDVYDIMKFWLNRGIDGFRMDVISLISKDPKYPDGPLVQNRKLGSYYAGAANGPKVHDYLQEMNREVLSKYDIMTVGETPHTSSKDGVLYADASRKELNMVFHFDHMHLDYGKYGKYSDKRFKLVDLKRVLSEWQNAMYEHDGWNSLYWSNHDQARPVTRFGDDDGKYRVESAKMLGTILHMQQGTPFIFEGEELGMTNAKYQSIDDYTDIETFNTYHRFIDQYKLPKDFTMRSVYLKSRDNARTPMPWSDKANAGFSTVNPWIKLNPNYKEINVENVLSDKNSVFYYYQKLIKLRHELPIITTGKYELLDKDNSKTYCYLRKGSEGTMFVAGNFATDSQVVNIPELSGSGKKLISNYDSPDVVKSGDIILPPYGTVVYLFEN